MPLRQAKTYQKIISKWTIPLRHTFMYYKTLFLLVLCDILFSELLDLGFWLSASHNHQNLHKIYLKYFTLCVMDQSNIQMFTFYLELLQFMNFLQHSLFVSPGYARWWTGATNGHLNQWQTSPGFSLRAQRSSKTCPQPQALAMLFGLTCAKPIQNIQSIQNNWNSILSSQKVLPPRKITPKICHLFTLLHNQWLTDSIHCSVLMNTHKHAGWQIWLLPSLHYIV